MKKGIIAIITLLTPVLLFGVDWDAKGYTLVSETNINEQIVATVKTPGSREFKVVYSEELSDKAVSRISKMAEDFYDWKTIPIKELRFMVLGKGIDAMILPVEFVYDGKDYAKYFPSGILFFFDMETQVLTYDFRLNIQESLFLRVQGTYINEKTLRENIELAVKNPSAYVKSLKVEFLNARIEKLENDVVELKNENRKNKAESRNIRNIIRAENMKLISRMQAENKKLRAEMDKLRGDMVAGDKKITEDLDALKKDYNSTIAVLKEDIFKLKWAVISLQNRGILGKVYPVTREQVEKVLEMKKANPDMTKEEIQKKLSEEKFKISGNEIFLILSTFYNEYKSPEKKKAK